MRDVLRPLADPPQNRAMANHRRNFLTQAATAAGALAFSRAGYSMTPLPVAQDQASAQAGSPAAKPDVAAASGEAVPVLRHAADIERVHFDRRYIQDLHGKPVVRDDTNGLPWTLVNQLASVAHTNFEKVKELLGAHPTLMNTRASWDE